MTKMNRVRGYTANQNYKKYMDAKNWHTSSCRSLTQSEVANAKAHAYLIGIACSFNKLCVLSKYNLRANKEESWSVIK